MQTSHIITNLLCLSRNIFVIKDAPKQPVQQHRLIFLTYLG